jgi:catechol 2,3-dioxygenase-like lactoylglutathione lyase family enzyme
MAWVAAVCGVAAVAAALGTGDSGARPASPPPQRPGPLQDLGITANNAFFYYADVERAARFYTDTLGFTVVADYGFAKILRLASTSFLTLVDATQGMHAADEPKTTALALVTDDLDAWHARVTARGVPLRGPYRTTPGRPHDGFVAIDPEGYFLEFERFNPHEENVRLMPVLDGLRPLAASGAPPAAGVKATVLWLYYRDLPAAQRFYEEKLGFSLIVDQGWAKIYRTSASGFVGLVDGARGMHRPTEKKGVTASFFTDAIDEWYARVRDGRLFELRTTGGVNRDEQGRYRAFVGYDPEGYYLEFDVFLPHERNTRLLEALAGR